MIKKIFYTLLVFVLLVTNTMQINIVAAESKTNLALNKKVTASAESADYPATKAVDGIVNEATAKPQNRWSAEKGPEQWLQVDLGKKSTFDEFRIAAEYAEAQKIGKFLIEGSNDGTAGSYETIYQSAEKLADGFDLDYLLTLDKEVSYRFVKITIQKLKTGAYNSVSLREFEVRGIEPEPSEPSDTPLNVNLALNKAVTASEAYGSMPASNLTDASESSRWSTEVAPTQWAYVDLGQTYEMNKFSMIWEKADCYAADYNIYVSDNTTDWGTPVVARKGNKDSKSVEMIKEAVTGRYVKLEVTKQQGYQSVSCSDFKVMLSDSEVPQDPTENVALGKTAVASSIETADLNAAKAFDGATTGKTSRWSTKTGSGPHWIYVDLGMLRDVKTIRLFWETRKVTSYKIQTATTLSSPMATSDWTDVKVIGDRPAKVNDKIVLDTTQKARYVRLYIDGITEEDPDGGVTWNTISLYEIEIYGGNPKESSSDLGDQIQIVDPKKGDKKLVIKYPTTDEYDIIFNGADYEQVVDQDLTIYEPVVDTNVLASFKITDKETKTYVFKEISVKIPGKYTINAEDNAAPVILPELREWKGSTGNFTIKGTSKIVIKNASLKDMADTFAKDYKELTGKSISVEIGSTVNAGDFYFELTSDTSKGLKDEGYLMDIKDEVKVTAETSTGAFWATRTILQTLKANGNTTIPKGLTRDYPLYKVRGFILDVARKTFTMDYLEQMVKQMSWYKLNDFQIHVNDNLIPIENLKDPMTGYSAFRLESDIKAGGNGGKNKQDLTSTDLFYTKNEFKNLIKESRTYGVNIVPEIDTPAHSLALTKVRPDLRLGTSGRQNDHLGLVNDFEECVDFVQSIFGEYMEGTDPVFDEQTTVHIGADEFGASSVQLRKFVNEMLRYVKGSGRKARVWGSFTVAGEGEKIDAEGVEINLWNFGYANMDKMYDDGYDLINCNDGNYYIVPNAGYYYDYLSNDTMYNLPINSIGGVTIPAGDKQMSGGAFAVWNDMTDYLDNGVSEYDVYDRVNRGLPLFAAKLWGKGSMDLTTAQAAANIGKDAPNTNFGYKTDSKTNGILNLPMDKMKDTTKNTRSISIGKNAKITTVDSKNAVSLRGNESYINTDLTTAGLGNDLRVKVKRTSASTEEQILFESSYGNIKAVQKDTGKVGFSRERFDYSFNYTLPVNEWVELEFKNQQNVTALYVNGNLMDTLGDGEKIEGRPMLATTMIPIERIGSKTKAFVGYVDDVRLGKNENFTSTMPLDYAVLNAATVMKTTEVDTTVLQGLLKDAKEVFTQYNPDANTITELTNKINEELNKITYDKADYSRVDAYLELTKDLSSFTDESVAALEGILNGIRKDLPKAMQKTVDGYEEALATGLAGLKPKSVLNVNFVENSNLIATASSFQPDGSNPSNAIDGNPNSMWHTNWTITTMPHWLDLEMKTPVEVKGLTYVPRNGGGNGTLTKYEIQIAGDDGVYTKIKEGTLAGNGDTKVIEFAPVTAKHVRLVYLEAKGNNGSAAEVKLHQSKVTADIAGLKEIIRKAEKIAKFDFTTESWNALQATIAEAKTLANATNPDAYLVEVKKQEVFTAMAALRLNIDSAVDKSELTNLYDFAESLKEADYTVDTWKALLTAKKEAKKVLDTTTTTKTEVEKALAELQYAIDDLIDRNADVSGLVALIESYRDLVKDNYTTNSWTSYQKELAKAEELIGKTDITQSTINAQKDALKKVKEALVDITALKESVANAKMKLATATTTSAKAIQKAINEAEAFYVNGTDETIMKSIKNLNTVVKNASIKGNVTSLKAVIDSYKGLVAKDYTATTWKSYQAALKEANKVLGNKDDMTQSQIDRAKTKLEVARKALKKVEVNKPEEPKDPEGPIQPSDPKDPTGPTKPNDDSVKTGDTTNVASLMFIFILGVGSAVFITYKKRKAKTNS